MNFSDIKLLALNGMALAISMSHVETGLKVILLVVSIGYTISKWVKLKQNKQ